MEYSKLQLECAQLVAQAGIAEDDFYGQGAICKLIAGVDADESNKALCRAAQFMDLPHPTGRDVHGENDFAAIRLAAALFLLQDKMYPETKRLIKTYLLERDFTSMYGSENHTFMMRAARFLAAEYYNERFVQFNLSADEAKKRDKAFILEYMQFRAKYGFGEFNSLCYLSEDLFMSSVLENYASDKDIKHAARMFNDIIVLEMFANNTDEGIVCGGLGRTYPNGITNLTYGAGIKSLIFDEIPCNSSNYVIAPYHIDGFVLEALKNRTYPREIFERKHLHSMYAWRSDVPDRAHLKKLADAGSISKYTYVDRLYAIGGINRQDEYPVDETGDAVYAHHQQVEWTCRIFGKTADDYTLIFASHPGETGEHNYWTGDLKCCCGRTYSDKNTCVTVFDIEKPGELEYTHIFIQPEKFEKFICESNRVFLSKNGCYACIFTHKPMRIEKGDFNSELICNGKRNAIGLKIYKASEFASFEEFTAKMNGLAFELDEIGMTLTFGGLVLNKSNAVENGVSRQEHTGFTRKSAFCTSEWGSGIFTLNDGAKTTVLDYNTFTVK